MSRFEIIMLVITVLVIAGIIAIVLIEGRNKKPVATTTQADEKNSSVIPIQTIVSVLALLVALYAIMQGCSALNR